MKRVLLASDNICSGRGLVNRIFSSRPIIFVVEGAWLTEYSPPAERVPSACFRCQGEARWEPFASLRGGRPLGKRFFSGVSGSCLPARARLANDKRGRRGFRVRVAWAVVPRKRGGFLDEASIASSKSVW